MSPRAVAVTAGAVVAFVAAAYLAFRLAAPGPDATLEAARQAYAQGRFVEAVRLYRGRIPEREEAVDLHREYQNAARQAGKKDPSILERVRGEYEGVVVRNPGRPWALYLRARLADGEAFQREILKVLTLDPGYLPAIVGYANWAYDEKRWKIAAEMFDEAEKRGHRESAERHLVASFRAERHDALDRQVARLLAEPPGSGVTLLAYPLGGGAVSIALLVAHDPAVPYLWGLQVVRPDNSFQFVSVTRTGDGYALHASTNWMDHRSGEQPVNGPEVVRQKEMPTFSQAYAEARKRIDEKKP